mmetsp:Transcript_4053/g.9739  ORF Transcript_4053/g.9739 Transcript_4053/m.9739 type:complete len:210 (+) Transcript_4053:1069-1698(+)
MDGLIRALARQIIERCLHHQQPLVGLLRDLRGVRQAIQTRGHGGAPSLLAAHGLGSLAGRLQDGALQGLKAQGGATLLLHDRLDGPSFFCVDGCPHACRVGHNQQQLEGQVLEAGAQPFRHAVHHFVDHDLLLNLGQLTYLFRRKANAVHGQRVEGHLDHLAPVGVLAQGAFHDDVVPVVQKLLHLKAKRFIRHPLVLWRQHLGCCARG